MIELLNLVVLLFFLYFVSVLIGKYNEMIFDRYRFRYFALRDRLALLVVKGELKEDSWEYKKLVDTINFHISTVETMSIERIVSLLVQYHTSPEEERNVRLIKKNIKNEEVLRIMGDFMETTASLLARNSRAQIRLVSLIHRFFGKNSPKRMHGLEKPEVALKKINDHREALAIAA